MASETRLPPGIPGIPASVSRDRSRPPTATPDSSVLLASPSQQQPTPASSSRTVTASKDTSHFAAPRRRTKARAHPLVSGSVQRGQEASRAPAPAQSDAPSVSATIDQSPAGRSSPPTFLGGTFLGGGERSPPPRTVHQGSQQRAGPSVVRAARERARSPNRSAHPARTAVTVAEAGPRCTGRPAPSASAAPTAVPAVSSGTVVEPKLEAYHAGEPEDELAPSRTAHLHSKEHTAYEQMHAANAKYMADYEEHKRDTSAMQIDIRKRSDWNEDKLEYACFLIEKRHSGIKAAAKQAGVVIGQLKQYWSNVFKHVDDEESGDESDDGNAHVAANTALVPSSSSEDED